MMLVINAVVNGVSCPDYIRWIDSDETAYDELTQLVIKGWQLRQALLIQGETRLSLPVEAFDGQPVREPLEQLRREWEVILHDKSATLPLARQWQQQLMLYYQAQIGFLQERIAYFEQARTRNAHRRPESFRCRLDEQYDTLLNSARRMLEQAQSSYEKALKRATGLGS